VPVSSTYPPRSSAIDTNMRKKTDNNARRFPIGRDRTPRSGGISSGVNTHLAAPDRDLQSIAPRVVSRITRSGKPAKRTNRGAHASGDAHRSRIAIAPSRKRSARRIRAGSGRRNASPPHVGVVSFVQPPPTRYRGETRNALVRQHELPLTSPAA